MAYRSSFEAESALITLNDELKIHINSLGVVEKEINDLRRQILEIRVKMAPLTEAARLGKQNVRTKGIEIDNVTKQFWSMKKAGE